MQKLSSTKLVLLETGQVIEASKVAKDDKVEFSGTIEVDKAGKVIEKSTGTALVKDLIDTDKSVVIAESSGDHHTTPEDAESGQDGTGTGSTVYYNPNNRNDGKVGDPLAVVNKNGTVGAPAFVFLGHELGHSRTEKRNK